MEIVSCTLRNEHKPWDEDEVDMLAELYFTEPRSPTIEIATKLGRSLKAIHTEFSRSGMSKPGAKLRPCIGAGCYGGQNFFSESAAQHICHRCKRLTIYRWAL